jgi:hypothetical protein
LTLGVSLYLPTQVCLT